MARECEERAMLDAALAFLDEWDLDVGGNGLRALVTPRGGGASSSARWTSEEDVAVAARALARSPGNDDADSSASSSESHPLAEEDAMRTRSSARHHAMDPRALALQTVKLRVKRRRHREELLELRESVQVLERKLADLKVSKYRGVDHAAATAAVRSHSALGRIWERLAERQLRERERVEGENRELKDMIDEHVKLVRSLERILRKRTKSQRLNPNGVLTDQSAATRAALRAAAAQAFNPLDDIDVICSKIPTILGRYGLLDKPQETPFRDARFSNNGKHGAFLELLDTRMLPFSMPVTSSALWQFLAEVTGGRSRVDFKMNANASGDIRMCTYGLEIANKQTPAAFQATAAMRKFAESERIVISWASRFQPALLPSAAGTRDCATAFGFSQRGWVVIVPSASNPHTAAVMHSFHRTEVEPVTAAVETTVETTVAVDPKVSALMDAVIHSTSARLSESHQSFENRMVEHHLVQV